VKTRTSLLFAPPQQTAQEERKEGRKKIEMGSFTEAFGGGGKRRRRRRGNLERKDATAWSRLQTTFSLQLSLSRTLPDDI
jgi:hypothetical protein